MQVGGKVICVNDKSNGRHMSDIHKNWVKEGDIYTVRRIEPSIDGRTRVLLEEIKNPPIYLSTLQGKAEPGFDGNRFKDYSDYVLENSNIEEVELEIETV